MAPNAREIVIFRRWRDQTGDVIALFPLVTHHGHYCTSYMHLGQHGEADYAGVVCRTRPATVQEAAPLKRELKQIGYQLDVRRRRPGRRAKGGDHGA